MFIAFKTTHAVQSFFTNTTRNKVKKLIEVVLKIQISSISSKA